MAPSGVQGLSRQLVAGDEGRNVFHPLFFAGVFSMDRCAIFVDVGYLMAEAGDILFNTLETHRHKMRPLCNYKDLLSNLEKLVCDDCQLPILRTYWYDGARDGFPTDEHRKIAELPNVKVRLGRMTGGQQKGVDALIYRDLMTLAQEKAIVTGYLLSGDEDLREGVIAAQERGVRIILLGIPSRQRGNQSSFLIQEVDAHITVEKEFLESYFSAPKTHNIKDNQKPTYRDIQTAEKIGREFARAWWNSEDTTSEQREELEGLFNSRPRHIPHEVDAQFLREAEKTFGSLAGGDWGRTLKRHLRNGFWEGIEQINPSAGYS